jgi:hypothetical protein
MVKTKKKDNKNMIFEGGGRRRKKILIATNHTTPNHMHRPGCDNTSNDITKDGFWLVVSIT